MQTAMELWATEVNEQYRSPTTTATLQPFPAVSQCGVSNFNPHPHIVIPYITRSTLILFSSSFATICFI
jgi:hypothetical protein